MSAGLDWWNEAPALAADAMERLRGSAGGMWFRIGDAALEVVSDHEPLLQELGEVYGDCGTPAPSAGALRIRCFASSLPGGPLLALSFDGPRVPDPLDVARSPYRFLRHQSYREAPAPKPGWRQLVNADADNRLLIASDGRLALIDLDVAPPEFVLDCMVGVAQGAQSGVLFLHGASVGVAGSGALLIGSTRGGKSTTALALAWRGHSFLGDDVAAVRCSTQELLPFPKSAGLRDGPLARSLDGRVRATRHVVAGGRWGIPRTLVRVSDLFPGSISGPVPLRFAFVLDGFADRAATSPFRPGLGELRRLKAVVNDTSSAWGLSPGRDLLNFLSVVNLLSRLRCHLVQLGPPEETASLIEAVMVGALMEGACQST